VLNQNVTAWRSAPAAVTIERTVVDWLAQAVACQNFHGVLTGGGSAANLMGLAMAREAKCPANERGVRAGIALAVYASSEVHMSIAKAIALLGIGRDNLRLIPVDDSFRMDPEELENAIRRDKKRGITPLAVVATAGTVNTGAIDPLRQIAGIASKNEAWLQPELELLAPIELSAVCFQYIGNRSLTDVELNRLNLDILRRVIERGHVYLQRNAEIKILPARLYSKSSYYQFGYRQHPERGLGSSTRSDVKNTASRVLRPLEGCSVVSSVPASSDEPESRRVTWSVLRSILRKSVRASMRAGF